MLARDACPFGLEYTANASAAKQCAVHYINCKIVYKANLDALTSLSSVYK